MGDYRHVMKFVGKRKEGETGEVQCGRMKR